MREKKKENLFKEIIAETISKLGKETDIQVQDAQTVPIKMNPNRFTSRCTVIKLAKIKDIEFIVLWNQIIS